MIGALALSEAFGPLGHAMHGMSNAKMCIKGELPSFLCKGDQIQEFKSNAKLARAALLITLSKSVARQPMANSLFDTLDTEIDNLSIALKSKDKSKSDKAMAGIEAVMARGHAEFAKH